MSGSGPGSAFRQDLPPPGGYRPIPFERIPAKQLLKCKSKSKLTSDFYLSIVFCLCNYLSNCIPMCLIYSSNTPGRLCRSYMGFKLSLLAECQEDESLENGDARSSSCFVPNVSSWNGSSVRVHLYLLFDFREFELWITSNFARYLNRYLTQIRKNRDEENRLMKDVPGWITGTYYGSPVFKSRDPEEWHDMSSTELFCHADPWYHRHHMQYHKWM